jgi:hypothetical protein
VKETTTVAYVVQEFYGEDGKEIWCDVNGFKGKHEFQIDGLKAIDNFRKEVPQIPFRLVKRTITEEVVETAG